MKLKLLALSLLFVSANASPADASCRMLPSDRAWLKGALANWQDEGAKWLALRVRELPLVLAIDSRCTYELRRGRFRGMTYRVHSADKALVGNKELPLGPISFADGSDRFVISLPSVWKATGVTSPLGLERLMDGVLLHEIAHTRQAALASAALTPIERSHQEEISDDRIQAVFENSPEYVKAYEAERDALYAAALAPNPTDARGHARRALALMKARRDRWFTGEREHYRTMDDIFLTMEGIGQWLIYRQFRSHGGGGLSHNEALAQARRGGRWWTQDEGLALILVADRLLPDWKRRAFREPDWRAENLLNAAAQS